MRIAINTRLLLKNKLEGIGWYTFETLKRIVQEHPEHEFFFIFDRAYNSDFIFSDNCKPIVLFPPTRHPLLWIIWFELQIPRILKKIKADIFLSPDGFLSLRSNIPSISVIHDINFAHRPKDLPWLYAKYYNYFFPKFAKKSTRIITVSEYSRQDIAKTYNISESKIDISYNGANSIFSPISSDKQKQIKEEVCDGCSYFMFVGAMHPRKNITGLLKAFNLFKKETGNNAKLVIVGERMFKTKEIETTFRNLESKSDIIFTGRLTPKELRNVLGSAIALVFISHFEGFGIPILEAMKCGTPVISSNTTSMPEVGGNSVIYVNPKNISNIASAMTTLFYNKDIRDILQKKGYVQAQKFNWDYTAQAVWKTILKTVEK